MNVRAPKFGKAFIEKQRNYLTQLRAALLAAARSDEADEANVKSDNDAGPREYGDAPMDGLVLGGGHQHEWR
jgi:hypothetical protein